LNCPVRGLIITQTTIPGHPNIICDFL